MPFIEGGSLEFEGELFEDSDLVKVYTGQDVKYYLSGYPARPYVCRYSIDLPIRGLVFTTTYQTPSASYSGTIEFKVASPDVVGWVPQKGVYHSNRLEFTSSEDLAKDPLKKADDKTVLDWVLGDDPF